MTEEVTAPESLEPEVVVIEEDARAALACLGDDYYGTSLTAEAALTGDVVAHAIARARTMGAFEERCRATGKAKRWMVSGVVVDIAGVTHASLNKELIGRRVEDLTADDIRRLVLLGWAKGGE